MTKSLDELNARFAVPELLRFESGSGGLTRAVMSTPVASAQVYLHGAHVTDFQHLGRPPLLFLSSKSSFTAEKAIRGGVPICFPWFAAGKNDDAPIFHGFARTSEWEVSSAGAVEDVFELRLALGSNDTTRAVWPYEFQAVYTVRVGSQLHSALQITNTGSKSFEFEEALHTYLHVADIRRTQLLGLAGTQYFDKADGMKKRTQGDAPIMFTAETDRIYLQTPSLCTINDPGGNNKIAVGNLDSKTTVVWNPGVEKAKEMADMGPDEWTRMLCVETCNVKDAAITLQPGQSHTMTAIIGSESVPQ